MPGEARSSRFVMTLGAWKTMQTAANVEIENPVTAKRKMSRQSGHFARKPDPDLFLAAAEKLNANIASSIVVGDSVWDLLAARRARALGVGLLSGGYGQDELERAGAYRVYQDPDDLLKHLNEVGVRTLS
jgi:phosphoglycolate phosphatase-like HAD superfamily hydrolase